MHDVNGTLLKEGDIIHIPAVITKLHPGEGYCNVNVETLAGRRPDGLKETICSVNTGVMVLVARHTCDQPTEASTT